MDERFGFAGDASAVPVGDSDVTGMAETSEDADLVAQGFAALTALRGPRADDDAELLGLLDSGLGPALAPLDLTTA